MTIFLLVMGFIGVAFIADFIFSGRSSNWLNGISTTNNEIQEQTRQIRKQTDLMERKMIDDMIERNKQEQRRQYEQMNHKK